MRTKKELLPGAVFYTSLLFILGVLFGYYIIAPLSVNFLGNYRVSESVISAPTLRSYVSTITSVVLAAGIVFQLPILVYFLSKVGLVTPDFLKRYRRHSLVLIVTLSAIITPPDVFSQVLVALPLMILYEIGIVISKRIVREREAELSGDTPTKKKKKSRKGQDPKDKPDPDGTSTPKDKAGPDGASAAKETEDPQEKSAEPEEASAAEGAAQPGEKPESGEEKENQNPKETKTTKKKTGETKKSAETKTTKKKTGETKKSAETKKKDEKPPWKQKGGSEETSPTDQPD
jgi:hypothetical protein